MTILFTGAVFTDLFASEDADLKIPIPSGRDIRKIRTPADLNDSDFAALVSPGEGLKYYYGRFSDTRKEAGRNLTKIDMHFITLLDLDYTGMESFATKILTSEEGVKSVDAVMESFPNLMAFFQGFSAGEIEKEVILRGELQDVTLKFKVDEKAISKRYPGLAGKINNHLKRFSLVVSDTDGDALLEFNYENNLACIHFLLDPKGYFVAYDKNGVAVNHGRKKLGLIDALRGSRIYLDASLDSSATLIKIFKLFTVEVKNIRIAVDFKMYEGKFGISFNVVDVEPGKIAVAGLDSKPIRDNLVHMKGTLSGAIDLHAARGPGGKNLTFLRVYGSGEEINHWLVDLALLTWEQIGGDVLADFSIPISDALSAVRKDVILNTTEQ